MMIQRKQKFKNTGIKGKPFLASLGSLLQMLFE